MKCEQIREILETLAPVAMACEWDNPGFQVCRWEKEINSIYLAVDATDEVIAEAKELKADMILTHHPLIFGGIKNVLTSDFIGRRIYGLAQQDMVYCAMHTNFDICVMADLAADYLELMETEPLEVTGEWQGKWYRQSGNAARGDKSRGLRQDCKKPVSDRSSKSIW